MKFQFIFFLLSSCVSQLVVCQNDILINLKRSTISSAGGFKNIHLNNKSYLVEQSIGQASVIGLLKGNNNKFRQGFIQPHIFSKINEKSIPLSLSLIVYPNPFLKEVTLVFKEPVFNTIKIVLYDMVGRLILSQKNNKSQKVVLNLNHLASANYIIKVIANDKQFIQSLIKN